MVSGSLEALAGELKTLENDLLYTEKAHFDLNRTLSRTHLILGLTACAASGIAAANVLAGTGRTFAAAAALIATIASAVLTFMRPDESAQKHLTAGHSLGALRVRVRHTLTLDAQHPDGDVETLRARLTEFADAKASIDERAPAITESAFLRARGKIRRGDFQPD